MIPKAVVFYATREGQARKVAERGLAASDVVDAIKNQNLDVAAGVIGGSPSVPGVSYQVAVNARGFTTMGDMPQFWAWALEQGKEFGGLPPPPRGLALRVSHQRGELSHDIGPAEAATADPRGNTTIAVVATNARLDKAACRRLAVMAQDGLARAIRPVHTPQDGDSVFALATGRCDLAPDPLAIAELGTLAADCLARAVARAVFHAETLGGARSWHETFGR